MKRSVGRTRKKAAELKPKTKEARTKAKPRPKATLQGPARAKAPTPMRGSLVRLRDGKISQQAVVCSNDIQNELSQWLLVVPVSKAGRTPKAPFAVPLGKGGDVLRCDWVTKVPRSQVEAIEIARLSKQVMRQLDEALRLVFDLDSKAVSQFLQARA